MSVYTVDRVIKFLKDYPWSVIVAAYGTLEIILKIASNASASAKAVRWILEQGTRVEQGKVVPAAWLVLVLTVALSGFAIFLTAYIITQVKLNRSVLSAGLRTLDGMFGATSKIRTSLWPPGLKPPITFTTIRQRHLIHRDLTLSAFNEHHVKALSGPVHYMVWSDTPEHEANPVDHLLEINFRVSDKTPAGTSETAYLQSENGPRSKEVLIYFLPVLQPAEPNPRVIEISYVWPGYYLRLKDKEEYSSLDLGKVPVGQTIDLVEFEFYLEPGTGKRLVCERSGSLQGNQSPPSAAVYKDQNGTDWQGWKYVIRHAPPEEYAVLLKLETS